MNKKSFDPLKGYSRVLMCNKLPTAGERCGDTIYLKKTGTDVEYWSQDGTIKKADLGNNWPNAIKNAAEGAAILDNEVVNQVTLLCDYSPLRNNWEKPIKSKRTPEKLEELQKKIRVRKIYKQEKDRSSREKYKIKKLGKLAILPIFFWLALITVAFYFLIAQNEKWYLFIPVVFFILIICGLEDIKDRWKEKLECKEAILNKNKNYLYANYDNGYIYTDVKWEYGFYKTARFLSYLVSVTILVTIIIFIAVNFDNINNKISEYNLMAIGFGILCVFIWDLYIRAKYLFAKIESLEKRLEKNEEQMKKDMKKYRSCFQKSLIGK